MSGSAILVIVFAAVIHAYWNVLAKRAVDFRIFGWICCLIGAVFYFPLAFYTFLNFDPGWNATTIGAVMVSVILQCIGFNCILYSYKVGDYSVMYPITRGSGPLVATLGAILFLGERPSTGALAGIALIAAGVFIIGGGASILSSKSLKPVAVGLATGAAIASVTVWSKYCLSDLSIPFVLLEYSGIVGVALVLTPYALGNRARAMKEWKENRNAAIGVAIMRSLAYMSILWVLTSTPVYYVAPLREMSILFAAVIGARLLKEGHLVRRLAAALVMFVGLVSLSLN